MTAMSELKITGNPNPVVGKEEFYSVNQLLPSILPFQNLENASTNLFEEVVEWSVHVLENGRWNKKGENNKTGNKVSYKFIQKSLEREGIRILAKRGEQIAKLNIKPQKAESPKIHSIEFLDKLGNKPTKPFAYGQTLKVRVHCLHMEQRTIYATLWEDDAAGGGHNKANAKNKMKTLPGTVKDGIADIDFVLEPDFAKIANSIKARGDAGEGKAHEYYVTAEILNKKTASKNINVANPEDKAATAKPVTTRKQTPAQKKGPSKKQEKEKSIFDDVIDWFEDKIQIEPIILPSPMEVINSVMKIFQPDKKEVEKEEEKKDPKNCNCEEKFKKVAPIILKHEGGYVNDPNDSGGETNKGITIGTFESFAKEDLGIEPTSENLKKITDEQATIIYRKRYWEPKGFCRIVDDMVSLMIYDWTITSGGAAKEVQKLLVNEFDQKISIDGGIGKQTITAINAIENQDKLLKRIGEIRKEYYINLAIKDGKHTKNYKFLDGWINRVEDCLTTKI
jgi:lysozyme family protein